MKKPKRIAKQAIKATTDPLAPRGSMTCSIDMNALRAITNMRDLFELRDGLHTIGDIVSAINCQPRFFSEDGAGNNAAGDLLTKLADFVFSYEQAVINLAKEAKPSASSDVEWRAWTLLGIEADFTDELSAVAVLATEAVRDHAQACKQEARFGAAR